MRPTRYLFVCTANINRSPSAARWAEQHFADRFVSCEIRSAGTFGADGFSAGADMILAMREHGFDLRDHRTSALTTELVQWADHIVVMEPAHAAVVLALLPEAQQQIVPLWEYLGDSPGYVIDPQGGELPGFYRCAEEIGRATATLVAEHLEKRRRGNPG